MYLLVELQIGSPIVYVCDGIVSSKEYGKLVPLSILTKIRRVVAGRDHPTRPASLKVRVSEDKLQSAKFQSLEYPLLLKVVTFVPAVNDVVPFE